MWLFSSLLHGLPAIPVFPMSVFRVLIGLAAAWKIVYELRVGGWNYFNQPSYVKWRYLNKLPLPHVAMSNTAYRGFNVAALVSVVLLIVGIYPQAAACILTLWFLFERTLTRLYHPAFLAICSLIISITPRIGECASLPVILDGAGWCQADPLTVVTTPLSCILMCAITVQMYLNSALIKAKSGQFRSGEALTILFKHMQIIKPQMPYKEMTYPQWLLNLFSPQGKGSESRWWRILSVCTIALEAAVPLLLLSPVRWIGIVIGVLMHLAFTGIFFKRLVPFGIASVSTYLLFIPPDAFTQLLTG